LNASDIWHRVVVLEPEAPVHASGTPEQQSCVSVSSETKIFVVKDRELENCQVFSHVGFQSGIEKYSKVPADSS